MADIKTGIILRLYARRLDTAIQNLRSELPEDLERFPEKHYLGQEGQEEATAWLNLDDTDFELRPTGDFVILEEIVKLCGELFEDAELIFANIDQADAESDQYE